MPRGNVKERKRGITAKASNLFHGSGFVFAVYLLPNVLFQRLPLLFVLFGILTNGNKSI